MNPSFVKLIFQFVFFVTQIACETSDSSETAPAIEIVGNKFYYSNNGSQFYIKGIAYQADTANSSSTATVNDPLADYDSCKRDLPYLKDLYTNVLRVYAVNTSLDHSDCMELFQQNGIYIIADLSEPSESISRNSPAWDLELYKRYTSVVDSLQNYTNVLGFFAGNEVTNSNNNTDASAFVKAAIRDTKQYISDQGYRSIPVGYSSNDDSDTRVAIADYFACGDDSERADFYGINMYEWCGESTFEDSGYADRTKEFSNLTIPIFFSEYGCNEVTPREFNEVQTLYGDDMTDVWSGGIVYMYFEETNNYGLVSIDGNDVKTLSDYNNLKSQLKSVSPSTATATSTGSSNSSVFSCPVTGVNWKASTDLPPTPDEDVCDCLDISLECVVSDDVSSDDYADLFNYLCSDMDCSDITSNGTTGDYGPYAYCDSKLKLSYLMNKYYESEDKHSSACSFSGSATLTSTDSSASTCKAVLSSASISASTTSASTQSGSSQSSSSSTSSSSKKSSATILKPSFNSNTMIVTSVLTFFFIGCGMVII